MNERPHAVFLSYASQDAAAAQRICEALRAGGIEVFLDQSELRGGDAWDQKIRREIQDCALFIPVISANTVSRHEGYFRLEWDLADQRTHMFARNRAFIVPVCLDATPDSLADVPESFQRVQWTRLPEGETPPAFVVRIKKLLLPEIPPASGAGSSTAPAIRQLVRSSKRSKPILFAIVALAFFATLAYFVADKFWLAKTVAFAPPAHSVAVLPFVNLSGDKEQEYFSDGLSEELLNSLSDINELQVAARTSAFSFKGKDTDIGTIARKLNVGAILEGSVRRSEHTIRVSAQLINAVTGFQLWSKSYDRDLGDVLKLQTEIATSVAGALKVTLLGDVAAKVELGGTSNPAAFDAYLRGAKVINSYRDSKDFSVAIAAFTEAIRLDPHYALAFARRSETLSKAAAQAESVAAAREGFDKAQVDAREALRIAPDLAQAHIALAGVAEVGTLDFTQANNEYERALALAPGDAQVLQISGLFAALMGHFETGIAALRRAVVLDPLARAGHFDLGLALYLARRYEEAAAALGEVISLDPEFKDIYGERGFAFYGLNDLQSARASCEIKPDYWFSQECLVMIYDKLGRRADAEAGLAKMKTAFGDSAAYQYAAIHAQWGDKRQALEWLETALKLRDSGLEWLKTDPLMDPLRQEPRFQAIERELRFPE